MEAFFPQIPAKDLDHALGDESGARLYALLVQPLLEELYRQQDFGFLDRIEPVQAWMVAYEYVRNQVLPGGFIQCIQNGYIHLIADLAEGLPAIDGMKEMARLLDQVLAWYVKHHRALSKEAGVEYFAQLYQMFPEAKDMDERFRSGDEKAIQAFSQYLRADLDRFCQLV